ncbi:hypothetical protein [Actinomadura sp. WMMB 499]|uniref:hypothetical protein n=1 Tax=Actinomadura sp. WMMB 499 TaxID=1219491 RepID=UPI0020C7AC6F|nr:hypothetical protein [Actinomadura sp. WMMB 499]
MTRGAGGGRTRRLALRTRLALLTAIAVALAVAACAAASWTLTRAQLYRELDHRLEGMAGERPGPGGAPPRRPTPPPHALQEVLRSCTAEPTAGTGFRPGGPVTMTQVLNARGERCTVPGSGAVQVTAADAAVARGEAPAPCTTAPAPPPTGSPPTCGS